MRNACIAKSLIPRKSRPIRPQDLEEDLNLVGLYFRERMTGLDRFTYQIDMTYPHSIPNIENAIYALGVYLVKANKALEFLPHNADATLEDQRAFEKILAATKAYGHLQKEIKDF